MGLDKKFCCWLMIIELDFEAIVPVEILDSNHRSNYLPLIEFLNELNFQRDGQ